MRIQLMICLSLVSINILASTSTVMSYRLDSGKYVALSLFQVPGVDQKFLEEAPDNSFERYFPKTRFLGQAGVDYIHHAEGFFPLLDSLRARTNGSAIAKLLYDLVNPNSSDYLYTYNPLQLNFPPNIRKAEVGIDRTRLKAVARFDPKLGTVINVPAFLELGQSSQYAVLLEAAGKVLQHFQEENPGIDRLSDDSLREIAAATVLDKLRPELDSEVTLGNTLRYYLELDTSVGYGGRNVLPRYYFATRTKEWSALKSFVAKLPLAERWSWTDVIKPMEEKCSSVLGKYLQWPLSYLDMDPCLSYIDDVSFAKLVAAATQKTEALPLVFNLDPRAGRRDYWSESGTENYDRKQGIRYALSILGPDSRELANLESAAALYPPRQISLALGDDSEFKNRIASTLKNPVWNYEAAFQYMGARVIRNYVGQKVVSRFE